MAEKTRFDLEQQIQECWMVTDDVDHIACLIMDDPSFEGLDPKHADRLSNLLFGVAQVYGMKFERCFKTFEELVHTGKIK